MSNLDKHLLDRILLHSAGRSIVRGTVNTRAVAEKLKTPEPEIITAVSHTKDSGVSTSFVAVSGRTGANATGHADSELTAALLAAYGPGPRGGAINISAAAAGEGKSRSTIKRWIKGQVSPLPENRAQLLANAHKAATTTSGRSAAIAAQAKSAAGKKMEKYGARLTVVAWQGPETYERWRPVYWDLTPEDAGELMKNYVDKGDVGLADFMADYAMSEKYDFQDSWNIFAWDTVTLDEKGK